MIALMCLAALWFPTVFVIFHMKKDHAFPHGLVGYRGRGAPDQLVCEQGNIKDYLETYERLELEFEHRGIDYKYVALSKDFEWPAKFRSGVSSPVADVLLRKVEDSGESSQTDVTTTFKSYMGPECDFYSKPVDLLWIFPECGLLTITHQDGALCVLNVLTNEVLTGKCTFDLVNDDFIVT